VAGQAFDYVVDVRQARASILGGCSSHNTMIALRPPAADFAD
jgi:choline dehydrogenase-like flavoprotein